MGNCMNLSVDDPFLSDHVDFIKRTGRSLRRMRNMFVSLAPIPAKKSKMQKLRGFGFSVVTKPAKAVTLIFMANVMENESVGHRLSIDVLNFVLDKRVMVT
mgnify:CR=1 FL=1